MKSALLVLGLLIGATAASAQTSYQPTGETLVGNSTVYFSYVLDDGTGMTVAVSAANCTFSIFAGSIINPNPQSTQDVGGCTNTQLAGPQFVATIPSMTINLAMTDGSTKVVTLEPTTWHVTSTVHCVRGCSYSYHLASYSTGITVQ